MAETPTGHLRHSDHCVDCAFYSVTFRDLGDGTFVRQTRCSRRDCDFLIGMPAVPAADSEPLGVAQDTRPPLPEEEARDET